MRMRRAAWILMALIAIGGARCGSTSPSTTGITLTGLVTITGTSSGIAGATLTVAAGTNAGKSATTDSTGHYTLTGLVAGSTSIRLSAANFVSTVMVVSVNANQTVNMFLSAAQSTGNARVVDAVSGQALANVTVQGTDVSGTVSDAAGAVVLSATSTSTLPRTVSITGPTTVLHRANVRVPGSAVVFPLIANSFDLASYDQMFRGTGGSMLRRWTSAPSLVIETHVLQFTGNSSLTDATALAEQLTDADVSALISDLTTALGQLTSGTFPNFQSTTVQTSAVGSSVHLAFANTIFVVREAGIGGETGTVAGLGSWHTEPDGSVDAGVVALDRDFDANLANILVRPQLRAHELGHALGYTHVGLRGSIMNPVLNGAGVTQFDLDACHIAFERPPGNIAPDSDPIASSVNEQALPGGWSRPIR
jgi:hypothetical protein